MDLFDHPWLDIDNLTFAGGKLTCKGCQVPAERVSVYLQPDMLRCPKCRLQGDEHVVLEAAIKHGQQHMAHHIVLAVTRGLHRPSDIASERVKLFPPSCPEFFFAAP